MVKYPIRLGLVSGLLFLESLLLGCAGGLYQTPADQFQNIRPYGNSIYYTRDGERYKIVVRECSKIENLRTEEMVCHPLKGNPKRCVVINFDCEGKPKWIGLGSE